MPHWFKRVVGQQRRRGGNYSSDRVSLAVAVPVVTPKSRLGAPSPAFRWMRQRAAAYRPLCLFVCAVLCCAVRCVCVYVCL